MKKKIKFRYGFTLIEVIMVFSIVIVMAFIFGSYLMDSYKMNQVVDKFNEAVENAKNSINIMTQEIREANNGKNSSYAIGAASEHEIIFYSDFDHDNETEKIRYYLDGKMLKKETTEPGTLPYYGGQPIASILSEYIEDATGMILTYYDENNNLIANPPENINQIRLIHIYLKIGKAPGDYIIETNVNIRNLKTNY